MSSEAAGRLRAILGHSEDLAARNPGATHWLVNVRVAKGSLTFATELDAADLRAVLDERDALARLLGIGADRDQWDATAETEGRRYETEQTGDTIVGYLAYQREDLKAQRHVLLGEIEELRAERDALAARVAELEAERDEDTRAMDRCWIAGSGPDAVPAAKALDCRFADRIAALRAARNERGGQ